MKYKNFGEFSLVVRKANALRLRRLIGFTLSQCHIPFYKFCERSGMKYHDIQRIMDGKVSPSCDRVMWLEYICEVFNVESQHQQLPPSGVTDEVFGL